MQLPNTYQSNYIWSCKTQTCTISKVVTKPTTTMSLIFIFSFFTLKTLVLISRGIPECVNPFNKGICRNVYEFCFHHSSYELEVFPSIEELELRARPYTCTDVISCRCCWFLKYHVIFYFFKTENCQPD